MRFKKAVQEGSRDISSKKGWQIMLIVIPTCNRLNYTKDSLLSVYADLMLSKKVHQLVIIDNGSKDGTCQLIENMVASWADQRITLMKMNQNVGKGVAVNMAVRQACCAEDESIYENMVLCSYDSDLIINNTGCNFFDRLESMFITASLIFKTGVLCVDQTVNSTHVYKEFKHLIRLPHTEEKMYLLTNGRGLAGGCLATYLQDFAKLGGYRANLGIFGGDDGYYIGDVCHKLHKKAGLAMSISVTHPIEQDKAYHDWKKKCNDDIIQHGKTEEKDFYDRK